MHTVCAFYLEDVESRELLESAMSGMISGLDQYLGYIAPDKFQRLEEQLDQEFGGVRIEIDKPDELTTLMALKTRPSHQQHAVQST